MALFKILKGNKENLPELKREGFAYFTIDENDFYVDTQSSDMDASGNFLFDSDGKPTGGTRKQLNANRAHYVKSKNLYKDSTFDQLYISDEEISLGRTAGESAYENGHVEDGSGLRSIAVGSNVSATGNYSQAFGSNTSASELNATAFGKGSIASGEASFVEGIDTEANEDGAHAEGISTKAQGDGAHAEGYMTIADGTYSHAEGKESIANGYGSHTEGIKTLTGEEGYYAHAEGSETQALGYASHAEGNNTIAEKEGAHAEGLGTDAIGEGSHAEGNHTKAEADYSHAEGNSSCARGISSHAEGEGTRAIGVASHSEGISTRAEGNYSHAGGNGSETEEHEGAFVHGLKLYAKSNYQTVFGKYSDALSTDAFVIGVGTSEEDCSNGFSVDWDGHGTLKDSLLVGRDPVLNLEVATKNYVDKKIDEVGEDKLFSYTTQLVADSSTITFENDKVNVNKCLIYYNGLLLILGENYTIIDEKSIQLTDWTAKSGDFFVVTGKQGGSSSSGSLDVGTVGSPTKPVYFNNGVPVACDLAFTGNSYLYSKLAGQNGISSITFNNDSNIDIHNCLVYCNGLLLVPEENYTITNNTTINLIGWTAEADDLFIIVSNQLSTSGNDYAEYRLADAKEPGRCVIEDESGVMKLSTERLQPGAEIISDTYGMLIGRQNNNQIPIASSGRVLAYPAEDRNTYSLGCAVCSGPNGTVSQMTREEIKEYPERIIGTVSEIPKYETWGDKNIKVNGRIWIRIR